MFIFSKYFMLCQMLTVQYIRCKTYRKTNNMILDQVSYKHVSFLKGNIENKTPSVLLNIEH